MKLNKIIFLTVLLFSCSDFKQCDYIGCNYLGQKYINNPLGEGIAPDTDPLIRTDAFDCMTFVETSITNGDLKKLNKIRYKNNEINFTNRNHFVETDWLEKNSDIFQNISDSYGKTKIRKVEIDKQKWFKKNYNINTDFKIETTEIKYIPYSELNNIKTDKPLLVLFIINNPKNYDKIGTDLAVSHMGFLLPNGMLRHASSSAGKVTDTDFKKYTESRSTDKNNSGVALYRIKND